MGGTGAEAPPSHTKQEEDSNKQTWYLVFHSQDSLMIQFAGDAPKKKD